jgi:hypothetical protein
LGEKQEREAAIRQSFLAAIDSVQKRLADGTKPHNAHASGMSVLHAPVRAMVDSTSDPNRKAALASAWQEYGQLTNRIPLPKHRPNAVGSMREDHAEGIELVASRLRKLRSFAED